MKQLAIGIIILTLAGAAAADPCYSLYSQSSNGGKAWLGVNAGGYVAGEGQTYHLNCDGKVLSVSFEIILDGQIWNDSPPLASGDALICSIRIPGVLTLASTTTLLHFDQGTEWVTFDFSSQNVDLTAGDYLLTCAPVGGGQARLGYWRDADDYPFGVRYVSEGGNNGPWIAIGAEFGDLAFQVDMDMPTPNEPSSWSAVKTLYR